MAKATPSRAAIKKRKQLQQEIDKAKKRKQLEDEKREQTKTQWY